MPTTHAPNAYYLSYSRLISKTQPEGDKTSFTYDSRDNITSVTATAKPSSGGGSILVSEASFACAGTICNQPVWTKDALGNQTDYTYDATHGGVLTVTLPADQHNLRLRTYNSYESYNTGNGVIYRLIRSETCGLNTAQLTLTACPAVASTQVSQTAYFGKTFQPLTTTHTNGAATLSETTTYSYDNVGNVTVVDGPRTDVDDRSYTTYDASRRKVYEGGILATAGLQRTVVHHVYDNVGREIRTETGYDDCRDGSGNLLTDGSEFVTRTTLNADINGDSVTDTLTYANSNSGIAACFVVKTFTRTTYDAIGRTIKTEVVQP